MVLEVRIVVSLSDLFVTGHTKGNFLSIENNQFYNFGGDNTVWFDVCNFNMLQP